MICHKTDSQEPDHLNRTWLGINADAKASSTAALHISRRGKGRGLRELGPDELREVGKTRNKIRLRGGLSKKLARPEGFEPPTLRS